MDSASEQASFGLNNSGLRDSNTVMLRDAKCKCNCQTRTVKILTAITVISCIVCLICVFTLLYFLFINKNTLGANSVPPWSDQQRLADSPRNFDVRSEKISSEDGVGVKRVLRADDDQGKKGRKRNKKNKKRRCKCHGKRGKRGAVGPPGEKGEKGDSADPIMAAHYASNFEGNEKKAFREGTKCLEFSRKTVCRNRTIVMPKNTRYDFLTPAEWYDEKHGPLMQQVYDKGLFVVQKTGIYQIYSTTHYYDAKLLFSQTIQINGETKFRCLDGIDYVKNQDASLNRRHKTCSITGVTKLMKGDELEIQNVFHDVTIDISKDRTYFGVIFLHQ